MSKLETAVRPLETMPQDPTNNTDKLSLEEQCTILEEKISAAKERLAEVEKQLDQERLIRKEMLEKRLEKSLEEEREKIREKIREEAMAKLYERERELDKWEKDIERRENALETIKSFYRKEMEQIAMHYLGSTEFLYHDQDA